MTEKTFRNRLVNELSKMGGVVRVNHGSVLAERGTPDVQWIVAGRTLWVELKIGSNQLSRSQEEYQKRLMIQGGCIVCTVWPSAFDTFIEFAQRWKELKYPKLVEPSCVTFACGIKIPRVLLQRGVSR